MKSYAQISRQKFNELKNKKNMIILGIETSCDETCVAVVKNGREILSNVVSSQIEIHKQFGGVVPEVASRNHILEIDRVFKNAITAAEIDLSEIDAVAVTYGAGLMGALLVGVNFAKAVAYALDVPIISISHVEGHIAANYLTHKELKPPFICLMVSGGHTAILKIIDYVTHKLLGSTLDDAVGEAFDKVARVLGLSYPGGVKIDELARNGNPCIKLLKSMPFQNTLNFSFSGIKTSVINYVNSLKQKNEIVNKENLCASFQSLVVEELVEKSIKACKIQGLKKLVVAGGVGANSYLQKRLKKECAKHQIELFIPDLKLCTDNAAMIAACAYFNILQERNFAELNLTAKPTVSL